MNSEVMTEQEARKIDLRIARSLEGKLCEGCPPPEFPDASTRCLPCPRRRQPTSGSAEGGQ